MTGYNSLHSHGGGGGEPIPKICSLTSAYVMWLRCACGTAGSQHVWGGKSDSKPAGATEQKTCLKMKAIEGWRGLRRSDIRHQQIECQLEGLSLIPRRQEK